MKRSPKRHVLAILRLELEIGQKELAAVVGCSRATIQAVELGNLNLSESLAARISIETGVDVGWLLKNDLGATIVPTGYQDMIYSPEPGVVSTPLWVPALFEEIQARKTVPLNPSDIYAAQLRGLRDHARLRAIVESARKKHLQDIARYRLDKFLDQMEAEFGFDPSVFPAKKIGLDAFAEAIKFAETEIESARRRLQFEIDEANPDTFSLANLEAHDRARMTMEAASPYEKVDESVVAERVSKFAKEKQQFREAMVQASESGELFRFLVEAGFAPQQTQDDASSSSPSSIKQKAARPKQRKSKESPSVRRSTKQGR